MLDSCCSSGCGGCIRSLVVRAPAAQVGGHVCMMGWFPIMLLYGLAAFNTDNNTWMNRSVAKDLCMHGKSVAYLRQGLAGQGPCLIFKVPTLLYLSLLAKNLGKKGLKLNVPIPDLIHTVEQMVKARVKETNYFSNIWHLYRVASDPRLSWLYLIVKLAGIKGAS